MAIDLGATHATAAIADLGGRILHSSTQKRDAAEVPETEPDTALNDGRELRQRAEGSDSPHGKRDRRSGSRRTPDRRPHEHADHARVDDLIDVKVSTGIGAGIISSGTLQRGAQGSAGDMGYVHVPLLA